MPTRPTPAEAPFHLTERLDGVVVRETLPAFLHGAAVGRAFMEALATLHAADWRALGLADFGKPDGFLTRQVDRWLAHPARVQFRELPGLDTAAQWLCALAVLWKVSGPVTPAQPGAQEERAPRAIGSPGFPPPRE